jgi:hypothetical protein
MLRSKFCFHQRGRGWGFSLSQVKIVVPYDGADMHTKMTKRKGFKLQKDCDGRGRAEVRWMQGAA